MANASVAPIRTPIVDSSTGLLTNPWVIFFQNFVLAANGMSGGGDGSSGFLSDGTDLSVAEIYDTIHQPFMSMLLEQNMPGPQDSGVVPGSYINVSFTVDRLGRITQASSGSSAPQSGVSDAVAVGATTGTVAVTFAKPYAVPPTVVCGVDNDAGMAVGCFVWPTAVTTTGFTANFLAASAITNTVHCNWIASEA